MRRKAKKNMTPQEKMDTLRRGARRASFQEVMDAGWEAGQVGYTTIQWDDSFSANYERFYFDDGTFCVVEWDDDGNISICDPL